MTQRLHAPLVQRIWVIAGSVSIRNKVLGITLGVVLLLGLGVTLQVRAVFRDRLKTQLQERGISITRDLAARSTDLILINDLYALHQLLTDTQTNNRDVRYAFVVDAEGRVLAHTFGSGFPPELLAANDATATEHHRMANLMTDEGPIWDIAVPIFDGRAGVAHVGISETSLNHTVNALTGQLLLITVIVSMIGVAAGGLLTWILTRPILSLVTAAKAVEQGDLSRRVTRWANDEIGDLAEAFNAMTEALAKVEQERLDRDQLRAQYVHGVIAAQEEERKRIARELHDGTGQTLTSLLVGLRALEGLCERPEILRHTEELRRIVGNAIEELHGLALELRPSMLDDLGLPAALERYVSDWRRRFNIPIDLTIHGVHDRRLRPEVETALYRILQEALTNVARHAQATTVSVLLERRQNVVLLIVEDNGCGFDLRAVSQGQRLGLYGMRERTELLNGKMTIESEPNKGTTLFIELPIDPIAPVPLAQDSVATT